MGALVTQKQGKALIDYIIVRFFRAYWICCFNPNRSPCHYLQPLASTIWKTTFCRIIGFNPDLHIAMTDTIIRLPLPSREDCTAVLRLKVGEGLLDSERCYAEEAALIFVVIKNINCARGGSGAPYGVPDFATDYKIAVALCWNSCSDYQGRFGRIGISCSSPRIFTEALAVVKQMCATWSMSFSTLLLWWVYSLWAYFNSSSWFKLRSSCKTFGL